MADFDAESVMYAYNHALLDTGASRNVAGEKWLNHYEDSLPPDLKGEVKSQHPEDLHFWNRSSSFNNDKNNTPGDRKLRTLLGCMCCGQRNTSPDIL